MAKDQCFLKGAGGPIIGISIIVGFVSLFIWIIGTACYYGYQWPVIGYVEQTKVVLIEEGTPSQWQLVTIVTKDGERNEYVNRFDYDIKQGWWYVFTMKRAMETKPYQAIYAYETIHDKRYSEPPDLTERRD